MPETTSEVVETIVRGAVREGVVDWVVLWELTRSEQYAG
jgi:hypothetical protein